MDAALRDDYMAMTWELRRAGIPTELYLGSAKGPGKQLKYADQYDIPLAILYGSNEKEQGVVTIKDLVAGRERMKPTADRKEYLAQRAGQITVPRAELVETIRRMLAENE
jgi:histidyl-tRNA synthetase